MSKHLCIFERVGRDHDVPPLTVEGKDADEIAFAVYNYVRPMLRSSEVDVIVNLDEGRGSIICGFHNGGTFTVEQAA